MTPRYFKSAAAFRAWLEKHYASKDELFLGLYKRGPGQKGLTYAEAMDEALAFGWIDGITRRVDAERYCIRFTPRRRGSTWSAVNIRKAKALIKQGRMAPPGLKAFRALRRANTGLYWYENRPRELPPAYARLFKSDARAWEFFRAQPPGYRRVATWWIVCAVKEETRQKRLRELIDMSAAGRRLGPLSPGQST